jgi:beta-glucanase (GH16 family)
MVAVERMNADSTAPGEGPVQLMMTRIVCIVLTLMVALCSCSGLASAAPGEVFEDFNGPAGSAPNPAYWDYVTGTGWDRGLENYVTAGAFLDGQSHLVIQAVDTGNGYTSGRIQTKNKLSLGYGTITARIKMPSGQGLWPAFWLIGADEDTTPWPQCGEIDIIELVGNATTYYTTLVGPGSGMPDNAGKGAQLGQFTGPIADLSTDYHDYWVTRVPDSITVGIDTKTLGTFTPQSLRPGAQWVYNRPMYAILDLAVGGWPGPPDKSTPFPTTMLVDWFRFEPLAG